MATTIEGTSGNDFLPDTSGDDLIYGYGGDDTMSATSGQDYVDGGSGDDVLNIYWGSATVGASVLTSVTYAYVGGDYTSAARRVDYSGVEHLRATTGSGDDHLQGFYNSWDIFDGGAGADRWSDQFYGLTTALSIDMALVSSAGGQSWWEGSTVRNVEAASLTLTQGNDTFRDHGAYDDNINGYSGDDDIGVSDGQDYVDGGSGDDLLTIDWANAAEDASVLTSVTYAYVGGDYNSAARRVDYSGIEHFDAVTGSGDDNLQGYYNSWDIFDGGAGADRWTDQFYGLTTALSIDMALVSSAGGQSWWEGSTVRNVEAASLTLTQGNDTFRDHGSYDDNINGYSGDDDIGVSDGQDYVDGGTGDDRLRINWSDASENVSVLTSVTYAYVGSDYNSAARRVDYSGVEHTIAATGSGDDYLQGYSNSWDVFNGGSGTDRWVDQFYGLTAGMEIDMAQVQTATGQGWADGSFVRNVEAATLTLTQGNDLFRDHGAYSDVIYGYDGDDDIGVSDGQDTVDGGTGDDTVTIDWASATANASVLTSVTYAYVGASFNEATRRVDYAGIEHFDALTGSGDDYLQGYSNSWDMFDGGSGTDRWVDQFSGRTAGLAVYMAQVQTATGQGWADGSHVRNVEAASLTLTQGNDVFRDAGAYDDTVDGYDGDDNLGVSDGRDYVNGGAGNDLLRVNWSSATQDAYFSNWSSSYGWVDTSVSFASALRSVDQTGIETVIVLTGSGDDSIQGGGGDDTLLGGAGNDTLRGAAGQDVLFGEYGNDALFGDDGIDRLEGGDGDDSLFGGNDFDVLAGDAGNDTLDGGAGNDQLYGGGGNDWLIGGAGNDHFFGGDGYDTADFSAANDALVANLNYGTWQVVSSGQGNARFDSVEGLEGGSAGDLLVGTTGGNVIRGNNGNDEIYGLAGADILDGGQGNDVIEGSGGNDSMQGGLGVDVLNYYNAAGAVAVNLNYQGSAQNVGGGMGIDWFTGFENLYGSNGYGDTLIGDGNANLILGYGGNDTLYGAAGNDTLYGMAGDDAFSGGLGADVLGGGGGSDYFDFNATAESTGGSRDTIVDFGVGGDVISLSTIDANTGVAGDQAFSFIGTAAFSGVAGQLRFSTDGTDGVVQGDVDGNGSADLEILLLGVTTVSAADFVL